jgi:hypothetical protein
VAASLVLKPFWHGKSRQTNRMRLSLRSLFLLMLLVVVAINCLTALLKSNTRSWAKGTSRGSAVDNPGYALLAAETVQLLGKEGFVSCNRPGAITDYASMQGTWFRSEKYNGLYVFVYADKRYYSADVFVSIRGTLSDVPILERYAEKLVADFKNLWDEKRHAPESFSEYNPD